MKRSMSFMIFFMICVSVALISDNALAAPKNKKDADKKGKEVAKKNDGWPANENEAPVNFIGTLYKIAGGNGQYYVKPDEGTVIYGRGPWALDLTAKDFKSNNLDPEQLLSKKVTVKGVFAIMKRTGEDQFKFAKIKSVEILEGEQELPAGPGSPEKGKTASSTSSAGKGNSTLSTKSSAFDRFKKK